MSEKADQGCVLYDDSCGFCRRWIPFWGRSLARRGFSIATLQSDGARSRLGCSDEELIADLRLMLPDGRQVIGAEVYRYVMRRMWWAWPVYLFAIMPGGRQAFDWGYRTFARHRFRISRACRLPGGLRDSAEPSAAAARGR
jgi:predicted DCC family thiol-disulfide oxidoreductase YuxK